MELVELVHAVGGCVRKRILLRVERASLDHGDRFGEIHAHRDRTEQFEGASMNFARQNANFHS